jgi:hypothetical protein
LSIAISLLLQPSHEVLALDEDRYDMPIAALRQAYDDERLLIEDALVASPSKRTENVLGKFLTRRGDGRPATEILLIQVRLQRA